MSGASATCGKGFNRPSSLKIHVNKHSGAQPFLCPFPGCGRARNVNSNMRRPRRFGLEVTPPLPSCRRSQLLAYDVICSKLAVPIVGPCQYNISSSSSTAHRSPISISPIFPTRNPTPTWRDARIGGLRMRPDRVVLFYRQGRDTHPCPCPCSSSTPVPLHAQRREPQYTCDSSHTRGGDTYGNGARSRSAAGHRHGHEHGSGVGIGVGVGYAMGAYSESDVRSEIGDRRCLVPFSSSDAPPSPFPFLSRS
ncbi:hypothetical protein B0H13DRAFT_2496866 [Mycena leptocephala]|nr:hypothetical protein B0H13DRAFT_2496866 [Mycena leptocephala]